MTGGALAVLLVALIAVSRRSVLAAEYVVGEGECSDQWAYGCFYHSWAANYNFFVGDILVFNFDPNSNSVAIVSKSEYSTCENGLSTIPKHIYNVSPTKLELMSSGDMYLISVGSGVRCYQKLHITVGSTTIRTSKTTATTTSSSFSEQDSESESSSTSDGNSSMVEGFVWALAAYGILLGSMSLTVYCIIHGRRQRQLMAQLQSQPNLQDETSPALYADGQCDVDVNEEGEYVANDQQPNAAATTRSVGDYRRVDVAAASAYNANLRLQDTQRSIDQLGRLG